jgi:DNA-binding NarL/FixJ family response regulator
VVDDHQPWRRFLCSTLQKQPKLQVIGEESDGPQAVRKAEELQPDLIVLDIGLPTMGGIEAARQIRKCFPRSVILFVSGYSTADMAEAALNTGAAGYVVKADVARELLPAVQAVLQGRRFIGSRFEELELAPAAYPEADTRAREHRHVVQFYADDEELLNSLSVLFGNTLAAGEVVVAVVTQPHREELENRLIANGIDLVQATTEGRFAILDAVDLLSSFMDANEPNKERFLAQIGNIIRRIEAAARVKSKRVVAFGEMVSVLWMQEKYDAAIRLEQLWNELSLPQSFYLCCAYPTRGFEGQFGGEPYARICAQHSDVVSAF